MSEFRRAMTESKDHLVLGLDDVNWQQAERLIADTKEHVGMFRLNSLAQQYGWEDAVRRISNLGALTMADPKYHDTPDTVYTSVKDLVTYGTTFITVQAAGGEKMLERSVQARDDGRREIENPFMKSHRDRIGGILAATVLTSFTEQDCQDIYGDNIKRQVLRMTHMAAEAGVDGVVCSAEEVSTIREHSDYDDLLVAVASVTPNGVDKPDEQKRTGPATQAIEEGADLLFLGRRIRKPKYMVSSYAAELIAADIAPEHYRQRAMRRPLARRARQRNKEQVFTDFSSKSAIS